MKALVLLLASVLCFGGMPAKAQEEETEDQGFKVYAKREVIYISNLDGSGERELTEGYHPALSPDRNHMAFGKRADLYLMDLETEEETLLLDNRTASPSGNGGGRTSPMAPQWPNHLF